jgi:hypothetical protein
MSNYAARCRGCARRAFKLSRNEKAADELEEKIERTNQLIDKIVYQLYNLTTEEIELIEQAVDG